MARPRPDDFGRNMRPSTSNTPATPISYSANVNRTKTKKWAQASTVDYGGDDWGEDEYDDYDDYAPQPVSQPRSAGLLQTGRAPTAGPSPQNVKKPYGDLPAVPSDANRGTPSSRVQRLNSFDRDDEKQAFSGSSAISSFPSNLSQQHNAPSSNYNPGRVYNTNTPQLSLETNHPSPVRQQPIRLGSSHADSPIATLPSFQQDRDLNRGQQADPVQFPPRKSSISQSGRPDISNLTSQTSAVETTDNRPSTSGSLRSPVAGKALPFIRPADIYKRHLEEQRESRRQSEESTRQSIDHQHRSNTSLHTDASRPYHVGNTDDNFDSESVQHGYDTTSDSRTRLEPVPERRSEYGFEGSTSATFLDQSQPTQIQHSTPLRDGVPLSTSPKLPDLNRISGFGMDMFFPTTSSEPQSATTSPNVTKDTDQLPKPRHEPALGPTSAVTQALDNNVYSPSSRSELAKRSDSESTGTMDISPIMGRDTSTSESHRPLPAENRNGSISTTRSSSIPAVHESSPARHPALALNSTTGSQSTHISEPSLATPVDSQQDVRSPSDRPAATGRMDSFRPSLPGGWTSYATTASIDSVASNDTVVPENSHSSPDHERVATPAAIEDNTGISAVHTATQPSIPSGIPTSTVRPAPHEQSIPKQVADAHDLDEHDNTPISRPTPRHVDSIMSTQTDVMDDENDKLRKEIIRSLSPVQAEHNSTLASVLMEPKSDNGLSVPFKQHDQYLKSDGTAASSHHMHDSLAPSHLESISVIVHPAFDDSDSPSVAPLRTSKSHETRPPMDEHRFSWETTPAMHTTSQFSSSNNFNNAHHNASGEAHEKSASNVEIDRESIISSTNSWDSSPVSEKEHTLGESAAQVETPAHTAPHAEKEVATYAHGGGRYETRVPALGTTGGGLMDFAAGDPVSNNSYQYPSTDLNTTTDTIGNAGMLGNEIGHDQHDRQIGHVPSNTDKALPDIAPTADVPNDSPNGMSDTTTSENVHKTFSYPPEPDLRLGNPRRASDFTKIVQFKDILAMPSAQDRIKAYNETREQFALMDNGLSDWLKAANSKYPDLNLADSSAYINNPKRGNKPAPLQQPYYQQYLDASSPTATTPLSSKRPPTRDGLSGGSQMSHFGSSAGSKAGAKSKELIGAAKGFGGMSVKVSKGLFAKGKSKIRGAGSGGGDKYDAPPHSTNTTLEDNDDLTAGLPRNVDFSASSTSYPPRASQRPSRTNRRASWGADLARRATETFSTGLRRASRTRGNRSVSAGDLGDQGRYSLPGDIVSTGGFGVHDFGLVDDGNESDDFDDNEHDEARRSRERKRAEVMLEGGRGTAVDYLIPEDVDGERPVLERPRPVSSTRNSGIEFAPEGSFGGFGAKIRTRAFSGTRSPNVPGTGNSHVRSVSTPMQGGSVMQNQRPMSESVLQRPRPVSERNVDEGVRVDEKTFFRPGSDTEAPTKSTISLQRQLAEKATRPNKLIADKRTETFRPRMPGSWISYSIVSDGPSRVNSSIVEVTSSQNTVPISDDAVVQQDLQSEISADTPSSRQSLIQEKIHGEDGPEPHLKTEAPSTGKPNLLSNEHKGEGRDPHINTGTSSAEALNPMLDENVVYPELNKPVLLDDEIQSRPGTGEWVSSPGPRSLSGLRGGLQSPLARRDSTKGARTQPETTGEVVSHEVSIGDDDDYHDAAGIPAPSTPLQHVGEGTVIENVVQNNADKQRDNDHRNLPLSDDEAGADHLTRNTRPSAGHPQASQQRARATMPSGRLTSPRIESFIAIPSTESKDLSHAALSGDVSLAKGQNASSMQVPTSVHQSQQKSSKQTSLPVSTFPIRTPTELDPGMSISIQSSSETQSQPRFIRTDLLDEGSRSLWMDQPTMENTRSSTPYDPLEPRKKLSSASLAGLTHNKLVQVLGYPDEGLSRDRVRNIELAEPDQSQQDRVYPRNGRSREQSAVRYQSHRHSGTPIMSRNASQERTNSLKGVARGHAISLGSTRRGLSSDALRNEDDKRSRSISSRLRRFSPSPRRASNVSSLAASSNDALRASARPTESLQKMDYGGTIMSSSSTDRSRSRHLDKGMTKAGVSPEDHQGYEEEYPGYDRHRGQGLSTIEHEDPVHTDSSAASSEIPLPGRDLRSSNSASGRSSLMEMPKPMMVKDRSISPISPIVPRYSHGSQSQEKVLPVGRNLGNAMIGAVTPNFHAQPEISNIELPPGHVTQKTNRQSYTISPPLRTAEEFHKQTMARYTNMPEDDIGTRKQFEEKERLYDSRTSRRSDGSIPVADPMRLAPTTQQYHLPNSQYVLPQHSSRSLRNMYMEDQNQHTPTSDRYIDPITKEPLLKSAPIVPSSEHSSTNSPAPRTLHRKESQIFNLRSTVDHGVQHNESRNAIFTSNAQTVTNSRTGSYAQQRVSSSGGLENVEIHNMTAASQPQTTDRETATSERLTSPTSVISSDGSQTSTALAPRRLPTTSLLDEPPYLPVAGNQVSHRLGEVETPRQHPVISDLDQHPAYRTSSVDSPRGTTIDQRQRPYTPMEEPQHLRYHSIDSIRARPPSDSSIQMTPAQMHAPSTVHFPHGGSASSTNLQTRDRARMISGDEKDDYTYDRQDDITQNHVTRATPRSYTPRFDEYESTDVPQPPSAARRYPELFKQDLPRPIVGQHNGYSGDIVGDEYSSNYYPASGTKPEATLPRLQGTEYALPGVGPADNHGSRRTRSTSRTRQNGKDQGLFRDISDRISSRRRSRDGQREQRTVEDDHIYASQTADQHVFDNQAADVNGIHTDKPRPKSQFSLIPKSRNASLSRPTTNSEYVEVEPHRETPPISLQNTRSGRRTSRGSSLPRFLRSSSRDTEGEPQERKRWLASREASRTRTEGPELAPQERKRWLASRETSRTRTEEPEIQPQERKRWLASREASRTRTSSISRDTETQPQERKRWLASREASRTRAGVERPLDSPQSLRPSELKDVKTTNADLVVPSQQGRRRSSVLSNLFGNKATSDMAPNHMGDSTSNFHEEHRYKDLYTSENAAHKVHDGSYNDVPVSQPLHTTAANVGSTNSVQRDGSSYNTTSDPISEAVSRQSRPWPKTLRSSSENTTLAHQPNDVGRDGYGLTVADGYQSQTAVQRTASNDVPRIETPPALRSNNADQGFFDPFGARSSSQAANVGASSENRTSLLPSTRREDETSHRQSMPFVGAGARSAPLHNNNMSTASQPRALSACKPVPAPAVYGNVDEGLFHRTDDGVSTAHHLHGGQHIGQNQTTPALHEQVINRKAISNMDPAAQYQPLDHNSKRSASVTRGHGYDNSSHNSANTGAHVSAPGRPYLAHRGSSVDSNYSQQQSFARSSSQNAGFVGNLVRRQSQASQQRTVAFLDHHTPSQSNYGRDSDNYHSSGAEPTTMSGANSSGVATSQSNYSNYSKPERKTERRRASTSGGFFSKLFGDKKHKRSSSAHGSSRANSSPAPAGILVNGGSRSATGNDNRDTTYASGTVGPRYSTDEYSSSRNTGNQPDGGFSHEPSAQRVSLDHNNLRTSHPVTNMEDTISPTNQHFGIAPHSSRPISHEDLIARSPARPNSNQQTPFPLTMPQRNEAPDARIVRPGRSDSIEAAQVNANSYVIGNRLSGTSTYGRAANTRYSDDDARKGIQSNGRAHHTDSSNDTPGRHSAELRVYQVPEQNIAGRTPSTRQQDFTSNGISRVSTATSQDRAPITYSEKTGLWSDGTRPTIRTGNTFTNASRSSTARNVSGSSSIRSAANDQRDRQEDYTSEMRPVTAQQQQQPQHMRDTTSSPTQYPVRQEHNYNAPVNGRSHEATTAPLALRQFSPDNSQDTTIRESLVPPPARDPRRLSGQISPAALAFANSPLPASQNTNANAVKGYNGYNDEDFFDTISQSSNERRSQESRGEMANMANLGSQYTARDLEHNHANRLSDSRSEEMGRYSQTQQYQQHNHEHDSQPQHPLQQHPHSLRSQRSHSSSPNSITHQKTSAPQLTSVSRSPAVQPLSPRPQKPSHEYSRGKEPGIYYEMDAEPVPNMSATSYPGMEWNPYGEWHEIED